MKARATRLLPWIGIVFGAELLIGAAVGWIRFLLGPTLRLGHGFPDFLETYSVARVEAEFGFHHLYDQPLLLEYQRRITGMRGIQVQPSTGPPYLEALFRPFALLDFHTAYVVWAVIAALLLAASLPLLLSAGGARGRSAWAIGLMAAAWVPMLAAVLQAQVAGVVMLGAAAGAYFWSRRQDDHRSGTAALLTLARPHLVVLLPVLYLVRRSWRNLAAFAVATAAIALVTLPLVGFSSWVEYAKVLLPGIEHGNVGFANAQQAPFGLRGLVEAVAGASPLDVALPIALLAAIAVLVGARPSAPLLDFGLVTVASLDASLHMNIHDLTLLLVGMVPTAAALTRGDSRHPALGWIAVGACYVLADAALFNPLLGAIGMQLLLAYLVLERAANTT